MKLWKQLKGIKVLMIFFKLFFYNTKPIAFLLIRLTDAYNFEFLADFEEHQSRNRDESKAVKRCTTCQEPAEKKCSRCEVVFYCCR